MGSSPAECVDAALAARRLLIGDDAISAYRVFNGQADGIDGLVIEKLGDVLVVQLHEGRLRLGQREVRAIVEDVRRRLGARAVYKKVFMHDRSHVPAAISAEHRQAKPWIGEPVEPEQVVTEYGLRFIVRPYDGFSVGLFLEHRENRRRVRELAAGRRVLNGFAYTCGFSVAAGVGAAASVVSVDLAARFLEWGKQNFAANGISTDNHRFLCCDIFDSYRRAARQQRRYDFVILDPPTFSRRRRPKGIFVLDEQMPQLAAGAIDLLDPGGLVLLAINDRQISRTRLEKELHAVARSSNRRCTIVERPELPVDFAGDPGYSKSVLARLD